MELNSWMIWEPFAHFNRGKETVRHLTEHHAKVYLAARSEPKATAAIEEIRENIPGADIRFLKLDMMDLAGVAAAAKEILRYFSSYHNNLMTKFTGITNSCSR